MSKERLERGNSIEDDVISIASQVNFCICRSVMIFVFELTVGKFTPQ